MASHPQVKVNIEARVREVSRYIKEAFGDSRRAFDELLDERRPICRKELPARGSE